MGVMTEQKLMGIVTDLFPEGMHPDYRSGLISGFHGINPSPCPTKNVRCAEEVAAGRSLREFYLGLSGETHDDQVATSVAELLCLDPKVAAKRSRTVSLASHQKGQLLNERVQERHSSGGASEHSRFDRILRSAEETGLDGCVSFP